MAANADRSTLSPSNLSSALRASGSSLASTVPPVTRTVSSGAIGPPSWVTDSETGRPLTSTTRPYAEDASQRSIAL